MGILQAYRYLSPLRSFAEIKFVRDSILCHTLFARYINIYRHKHTQKKTYPNYFPFSIRLLFGHNQVTAMYVSPIWRIYLSMRRQVLVARLRICLLISESLERYNIYCILKRKKHQKLLSTSKLLVFSFLFSTEDEPRIYPFF